MEFFSLDREQSKDPAGLIFLLLMLAADCSFIWLHFLTKTRFGIPLFSLEADGSYSEFFNYTKEFWIVLLFANLFFRTKAFGYAVWAGLFLYLLADDSLRIHEIVGGYIASTFDLHAFMGLRGKDFGELAVSAIVGGTFFSALALCFVTGSRAVKRASRNLVLLLLLLVFFGVFVDMVHMMIHGGDITIFFLGIIEDGGEMIVMSFLVWYVFLLNCGVHASLDPHD